MDNKKLLEAALNLPPEDRAHLVHDLLTSLDSSVDAGVGAAWIAELEKCCREFADDSVDAPHWEVVLKRMYLRLQDPRS